MLAPVFAAVMAACTSMCFAAASARAADLVARPAPIVQPLPDWGGFYVGVHEGLADAFTNYDYSTLFSGNLNNHTRIGRINGAAPGVYGGYNLQLGSVVVGIEGDATFTNGMFRLNGPNVDFLQNSNKIITVSGRAGYLVTPATMFYGRVGYSRIDVSGIQGFGTQFHQTLPGTQTGVGIEHLITNNIALRVEGTYTKSDANLVLNQGFDQYRPSFLQVTAGLAFKIDPAPYPIEMPRIDLPNRLVTYTPSWTSVYAGGLAGIAASQVTRFDRTFGLMGPYSDLRLAAGALVGADLQLFKYFVAGASVDTIATHAKFDDDVGVGVRPVQHRFAYVDRVSAVTGRFGVLPSPTLLVYGKVGPAQIKFRPDQNYFAAINPTVTVQSHDLTSFQAGGGMETVVANHVALRIETLYTRALHPVVINGVQPGQTTLQPSTLTGMAGLVVKY